MTVDLNDFEYVVMNSGVSGEFYGEYHGRGSHHGYAVSLDHVSELFALGVVMANEPLVSRLTNVSPHVDSLGRGIIASWPARLFKADAS